MKFLGADLVWLSHHLVTSTWTALEVCFTFAKQANANVSTNEQTLLEMNSGIEVSIYTQYWISDVAIGAPYGGENGRGVVYIYLGSKSGISEKHSQAITAEEISPTLTTFGFSLSGGVDLDNNNYTDLAVGAYKSDSIVFLK